VRIRPLCARTTLEPVNRRTHYALTADGVHIAFRVHGAGPMDLLLVTDNISHVEVAWELEAGSRFLERLASFSRVILFDRRGNGLSDPTHAPATLEEQMADVDAVLDAVGSSQTWVFAELEGSTLAMLYAATHPSRVRALAILHGYARTTRTDDYPFGSTPEERETNLVRPVLRTWEEGRHVRVLVPSLERESPEAVAEWAGRLQRYSASPGTARRLYDLIGEFDVRDVLGQVRAPTLVMHREASQWMDAGHSRYLVEHLPDSRYLALPGEDTVSFGDRAGPLLDALEEFFTGVPPRRAAPSDRILATVLFTDIVDSTRRAAELGDAEWGRLLDRYNRIAIEMVERYRGRLIKSLGDGHLATFDGPARGIRCALALIEETRPLGIELRAGLHTGEIELLNGDVGGIGVHIGARVAALAGSEEVLVSSTVADLVVGSGIRFEPHGQHELKGVPSPWTILRVAGS
jgi:class 3 adenylate cyclase